MSTSPQNPLLNYDSLLDLDFFTHSGQREYQSRSFLQDIVQHTKGAQQNLGTFSNQYIDQEVRKEVLKLIPLNGINKKNYNFIEHCRQQCTNVFSKLFGCEDLLHCQNTVGSSEAILLAIYSLLNLWKSKQPVNAINSTPEIILGQNVHSHIHSLAMILNIKISIVPCDFHLFSMNLEKIGPLLNPNVIGIVLTAGSTYTGETDNIEEVNDILHRYWRISGTFIPMHVDAASGGFILPFVSYKNKWNFRLKHVCSMNVSSHKFGFTYPSLGWYMCRKQLHSNFGIQTPVDYLHGHFDVSSIHFSCSVYNLILQSYNLIKYGADGYTHQVEELLKLKIYVAEALSKIKEITLHTSPNAILPVIVFSYGDNEIDLLTSQLFQKGWSIPTYSIPTSTQKIARIVIRKGMDKALLDNLVGDIVYIINHK